MSADPLELQPSKRVYISPSNNNDHNKISTEIHNAYQNRDALKSRQLHESKMKHKIPSTIDEDEDDAYVIELSTEEEHRAYGDYIKSMIYGGLDGIITTFAIVAGIAGADFPSEVILVLGFANLIADAISMGIGDYLSEKSEIEYIQSEQKREQWEFDNFQEGEIQEMIEIYQRKGVSKQDSETILRTMSKYRDFFINHMMIQELELYPPNGNEQPVKGGMVTLLSFLCFGCIPLLSFVAMYEIDFDSNGFGFDPRFTISCLLTVLTLVGLGIFKGKITESSIVKSSFFITVNGVLAAGSAYLIAFGLSHVTGVHG